MKKSFKINVLNEPLQSCCDEPKTGFFRDGYCRTDDHDFGRHIICAIVTQKFLDFSLRKGNDLITPNPEAAFPGLKPNGRWCLCAQRWCEAFEAGCAPKVDLNATDIKALEFVPIEILREYSHHK